MQLYEFVVLDNLGKVDALWNHGALIGERMDCMYRIFLYQIDSFYVEVFCTLDRNTLSNIDCFTDMNRLHPYLDKISLCSLL